MTHMFSLLLVSVYAGQLAKRQQLQFTVIDKDKFINQKSRTV